jgi:hypothetical protein
MAKPNLFQLFVLGALALRAVTVQAQPTITTQPESHNTSAGSDVSFNVAATGTGTLTYQWYYDSSPLAGKTLTNLTINGLLVGDSGIYFARVGDDGGYTTSSNAVLNVGISNTFTLEPTSLVVTQGQNAAFAAASSGTPVNYFWRKNGNVIAGATNASFTVSNVTYNANNNNTYQCQISNFLNSVTSTNALLTVYYPPTITLQPVGKTNGVGTRFTLSVAANGNPAVHYQWRTNGTPIALATGGSYSVASAQTGDDGIYDVVITNAAGSTNSKPVNVSVIYLAPAIMVQPEGTNVALGSPFILAASATGSAPLTWQWRTNGTPIPGATTNRYAVNAAQFANAGLYDVVVTNLVGGTNSNVAVVNVGYAPTIVQQPLSLTNNAGDTVSFSCIATGAAPVSLQWTLNGYAIADQTNFGLTVTNVQATNIGFYALMATNMFGSTASSNAALSLNGFNFTQWAGLEAYYPLDGNALDASGNGNDGTNLVRLQPATDSETPMPQCLSMELTIIFNVGRVPILGRP